MFDVQNRRAIRGETMIYYTKNFSSETTPKRIDLELVRHRITLFHLFASGEKCTFRKAIARIRFVLMTCGKAEEIAVYCNGVFAHSSLINPKCIKYPFLDNNEYVIGPCITEKAFRGQGIYPYVLNWITESYCENARYYMFVNDDNYASIRGIEKAGFEYRGEAYEDRLKHYHI